MGLQLPRNSAALTPTPRPEAVRRRVGVSWLSWVGLAALAVAYVPVFLRHGTAAALPALPWVIAPFLAASGWAFAARRAEARARLAFRTFQAAGVLGVLAHLAVTYAVPRGGAGSGFLPYLVLAPVLVIAVGAGLTMGTRSSLRNPAWTPRLAADTTLIVLAGIAAVLRVVVEPALGSGAALGLGDIVLVVPEVLAIVPVILAAHLVLGQVSPLSPWAGALLLASTVAFGLAALVSLGDPAGLVSVTGVGDYAELAGWAVFAAAGFFARRVPATAPAMVAGRRVPDRVRRMVVPGAALFLAVAITDIGFGPPPHPVTVGAVALLGLVLSLRTVQAFSLTDRDARQRRRLAHNRALVEVTHALAGATDLDETLRIISESARDVFGTRGAGIELLTDDGEKLETRAAVGLPEDVVGLEFPIEGSFTGWVVRHEEPRASVDPSRDPYIQPQSLAFLGRWPVAAAPIAFRGETLGALFACIRSQPFDPEELELMGAMAEQAAIAIQQARLFEKVTILSVTDPLTGLANRRQLERELDREFAAARRGRDLSAVLFDLDGFKAYNDTFGHLAGDEALQTFGRALRAETRTMNLFARYGGDEFVVLLAGTDARGARTFVERVRIRFGALLSAEGRGQLAISAGVAEYAPDMERPEALLRKADQELYRAKPRIGAR